MISCKRSKFTLPKKVTYLNCAYMSPLLKSAEKVGIQNLRRKRNPSTILAEDFFTEGEILRDEFARLINVNNPKRIAIVPSVSYGIANVALNLKISRGEKIIVGLRTLFPTNSVHCEQCSRPQRRHPLIFRFSRWNVNLVSIA